MMFVGFLGCYGAIQESQCLLGTFFTCLVILFACEVAAGIWGFVNRDKIAKDVKQFYDQALNKAVLEDDASNAKTVVKSFHETLGCCGSDALTSLITAAVKSELCPSGSNVLITPFKVRSVRPRAGGDAGRLGGEPGLSWGISVGARLCPSCLLSFSLPPVCAWMWVWGSPRGSLSRSRSFPLVDDFCLMCLACFSQPASEGWAGGGWAGSHSSWSRGHLSCSSLQANCHQKIDELFSGKLYLIGIAAIVVAVIMVRKGAQRGGSPGKAWQAPATGVLFTDGGTPITASPKGLCCLRLNP
uniref:Tetraspanin n=1 Tax=Vombatus ursinus TaxID=29139 RepID=A0A4X2L3N5_VOMUR